MEWQTVPRLLQDVQSTAYAAEKASRKICRSEARHPRHIKSTLMF